MLYAFSAPKEYYSFPPFQRESFTGTLTIEGDTFALRSSGGSFTDHMPATGFASHDVWGDFCVWLMIDFNQQVVSITDIASSYEYTAHAHYEPLAAAIPEPGVLPFILAGIAAIAAWKRRPACKPTATEREFLAEW